MDIIKVNQINFAAISPKNDLSGILLQTKTVKNRRNGFCKVASGLHVERVYVKIKLWCREIIKSIKKVNFGAHFYYKWANKNYYPIKRD